MLIRRSCVTFIIHKTAKRNFDCFLRPFSNNSDFYLGSYAAFSNQTRQMTGIIDRLSIEANNDSPSFERVTLAAGVFKQPRNHRPLCFLEIDGLCHLFSTGLNAHAEPAAANLAKVLKLVNNA